MQITVFFFRSKTRFETEAHGELQNGLSIHYLVCIHAGSETAAAPVSTELLTSQLRHKLADAQLSPTGPGRGRDGTLTN